jgi:uncharacterized oxidoreductase
MKISGNTILITGGAGGIGLELAKQLESRGNKVIITGRDQTKLQKAKEQLPNIHIIRSDVTNPKEIEALFTRIKKDFPDTNILINNAGIMHTVNVHDTDGTLEDITQEVETNLNGPIRMIKTFLEHLKSKPSAAIVNVTSGLAFTPLPTSPIYCATKAGLHSYTLSLRVQLQRTQVKVFELAPPATKTELLDSSDAEDMKGITVMPVQDLAAAAVKGLERDQFEIRPGQANLLKLMSRLAPGFIVKQMSAPVNRMLDKSKN